jgi:hypothetical protein
MSKNVPADRFTTICTGKQSARTWITLNLVGQENGDIELCDVLTL